MAGPEGGLRPVMGRVIAWRQKLSDSLIRNSIMMMATTALTSLLGYVFWLAAARTSPTHVVGLAAAIVSAMGLVNALAGLGVGAGLIERLPRQSTPGDWWLTFCTGISTASVVGGTVAVLFVIVMPLLSGQFAILHQSPAYVLAFVLGTVATVLAATADYAFIAERTAVNMLARNAITSISKLAMIGLIVLVATSSSISLVWAWSLAALLGGAVAVLVMAPRIRPWEVPSPRAVAREARRLMPRFVGHQCIGLGGLLPTYALPILVTARLSASDNAYFYTAWMVGGVFFMISPAVAASLFAEGSHSAHQLGSNMRRAMITILILLVPCMIAFLVGGNLILSAFGSGYPQHAHLLLVLLVITAIPDAITNLYVSVARVQGKLTSAAILNVSMAIAALVISWVLLPSTGLAGVGWAWLAAQGGGALIVLASFARRAPRLVPKKRLVESDVRKAAYP